MMMEDVFSEGVRALARGAAAAMAEEIKEIYEAGGEPEWEPVTPNWLYYKAMHGYDTRTMHQTNALWGNVQELHLRLHSFYEPVSGTFAIEGLDTAFLGTEYVWRHELVGVGANRTRRPFIMQGILRTLNTMAMGDEFLLQLIGMLHNQQVPMEVRLAPGGVSVVQSQYAWHKTRFHSSIISLLWWLLPPSKVLAWYGATMDIAGIASGKLLEPRYLSLWITAYLKGTMAARAGLVATEKQLRRKGRRGLWGRRR